MDDWSLLRRYVEEHDEDAFTELVQRHAGWLLNALIRQLQDHDAAAEVRQQAFTLLAQKAPVLRKGVHVGGWLFTTARFLAAHNQRGDRRRNYYLNQASRDPASAMNPSPASSEAEIDSQIDSAIAALPKVDQQAILLRFFEKKKFAEIGAAMSLSEESVRKRVSRALLVLRKQLGKSGVGSTPTWVAADP